ncbi:hypothetical protein [Priestia megaterium]|uniref:Uncharacterized protein n=1 Tax=Priestia megaterium TaxID=1404 RepID=A0A6M6E468_PRIMG|nr:hypothetical protein [Priestia megaterium]QJX80404.1 hypothetical protein FDZ14_30420 [Priestia megaterium]
MPEKELEQMMEFIETLEGLIGKKKSKTIEKALLKAMVHLVSDNGENNTSTSCTCADDAFFLFQAIEAIVPVLNKERKSVKLRIQMNRKVYRNFLEILHKLNLEKDDTLNNENRDNWIISVRDCRSYSGLNVFLNPFHRLRQLRP